MGVAIAVAGLLFWALMSTQLMVRGVDVARSLAAGGVGALAACGLMVGLDRLIDAVAPTTVAIVGA